MFPDLALFRRTAYWDPRSLQFLTPGRSPASGAPLLLRTAVLIKPWQVLEELFGKPCGLVLEGPDLVTRFSLPKVCKEGCRRRDHSRVCLSTFVSGWLCVRQTLHCQFLYGYDHFRVEGVVAMCKLCMCAQVSVYTVWMTPT